MFTFTLLALDRFGDSARVLVCRKVMEEVRTRVERFQETSGGRAESSSMSARGGCVQKSDLSMDDRARQFNPRRDGTTEDIL